MDEYADYRERTKMDGVKSVLKKVFGAIKTIFVLVGKGIVAIFKIFYNWQKSVYEKWWAEADAEKKGGKKKKEYYYFDRKKRGLVFY